MKSIVASKRYSMLEVAQLLNIHIATTWRWHLHGVRGRKLPTVLVGARRYVLAEDLDTFLAGGNPALQQDDVALGRRAKDAGRLLDAQGVRVHPVADDVEIEGKGKSPKQGK